MKKTIIIVLTLFVTSGCNLLKSRSHPADPVVIQQDVALQGTTQSDNDTIQPIYFTDNSALVEIKQPEGEWIVLNKYEYAMTPLPMGGASLAFKNKVTILPDGRLRFQTPREPVAPAGTIYRVTPNNQGNDLY